MRISKIVVVFALIVAGAPHNVWEQEKVFVSKGITCGGDLCDYPVILG